MFIKVFKTSKDGHLMGRNPENVVSKIFAGTSGHNLDQKPVQIYLLSNLDTCMRRHWSLFQMADPKKTSTCSNANFDQTNIQYLKTCKESYLFPKWWWFLWMLTWARCRNVRRYAAYEFEFEGVSDSCPDDILYSAEDHPCFASDVLKKWIK